MENPGVDGSVILRRILFFNRAFWYNYVL